MVDIFVHPESPFSVETYNFYREIETISRELDEIDVLNYYDSHKLEFKTYVEKPLEEIANRVSNQLFLEIEVYKECVLDDFILGNNQFYFYLYPHKQESENMEINTCLFMNFPGEHINNNYPTLNIGMYVDGSSPDKKRFLDNYQGKFATKVPEIIFQHTYLSEKYSLLDSWLSSKKLHPFNRLGDWFKILSRKNSSIKDIKIIDCLPLEELLRYSRKQLIESITLKFEGIFPLLLLAISNNILLDISSYLEYRYNKYPHLFNPFNLFNIDFTSENNKVIQASKEKQNQPKYTLTQCLGVK
ncbi:MAG: hypothetical protein QNJ74_06510 [Trichodesmium sp. MO_231.B1]|nr:hypothetical protein [Trichodesmium sp. MO_231.B1]